MKRYHLDGIAGLVERKNNRSTGLPMELFAADQTDIDVGGDRWAVVCAEHGSIVGAPNLALARQSMAYPMWCEECSGNTDVD